MIQTQIDFDELKEKTSEEFVVAVKHTADHIKQSPHLEEQEKEIQYAIVEDEYSLKVLVNSYGNLEKFVYRFSTGRFDHDAMWWVDIRKFFDIPLEMKKLNGRKEIS